MAHDHPTATRPLWRDSASSPGRTPIGPRPFLTKLLLVATGCLFAIAAAAGMLSWLVGTPRTHFVSCWGTNFRDPTIPPNAAADCDRLAFRQANLFARSDVASMTVQSESLITQQLDALAESSRKENIILYVGTYAIVGADGKIVLLTSDYDPGQPGVA